MLIALMVYFSIDNILNNHKNMKCAFSITLMGKTWKLLNPLEEWATFFWERGWVNSTQVDVGWPMFHLLMTINPKKSLHPTVCVYQRMACPPGWSLSNTSQIIPKHDLTVLNLLKISPSKYSIICYVVLKMISLKHYICTKKMQNKVLCHLQVERVITVAYSLPTVACTRGAVVVGMGHLR